jgi:hypothetical protein
MFAVAGTAIAAAAIGLAGSAHANPFSAQFELPSADISCNLVNQPPTDTHSLPNNFVQCDIVNQSLVPPRPPPDGRPEATSTFLLKRGQLPILGYSPGTLAAADQADYSQPVSGGSIICTSEQSSVRCTDISTGHFFRVSRESYELG